MDILSRNLANLFWLEKFSIFKPENLQTSSTLDKKILPWGNYSIGQNLYPQLFEIFVKYSPTANFILNKISRYAFGNIPKEQKNIKTTFEGGFSDTLQAQIKRAGRDAFLFGGAFAIWVGYSENGFINEFRTIPVSRVRYVSRETLDLNVSRETYGDENIQQDTTFDNLTSQKYLIGVLDNETATKYQELFFQYEPEKINQQNENFEDLQKNDSRLKKGQILFCNPASIAQVYPDCVFDNALPLLLSDAGCDTLVMSFLGNSDLLKTYRRNSGGGGADIANNSQLTDNLWSCYNNGGVGFSTVPQNSSAFYETGVKSAGQVEAINLLDETKVQDSVYISDFPTFTDELSKIDNRIGLRLCAALEIPYELLFKMDSGVLNQDNRATMISEINFLLDDYRETLENIFNDIISHSKRPFKIEILPFGGDKIEVKRATDNITK